VKPSVLTPDREARKNLEKAKAAVEERKKDLEEAKAEEAVFHSAIFDAI
jgi:hypothetical protein